ncbi:MAG: aminotransferase class V-fold PLP-dependent enzyme [Bryobacteraceae bacterium]
MTVDWKQIRAQFPALANWTYLNSATFGQIPLRSIEAVSQHFARRNELGCSDFGSWFDDADRVRALAARLVHCQASDIAFAPTSSHAISLLLSGLSWKPGDRVVTFAEEYPNNTYGPALLRRHGVEMVETTWPEFYDAVNERTRLVITSQVNYSTGFRPPLAEISRFLRGKNTLLYVDGTQCVGAIPIDVTDVHVDMLAVHAYKWMLSPNGATFMYVSPRLRECLEPNIIGWRSHREWRQIDNLCNGEMVLSSDAERYEGGMLVFAVLYGLGASIEMFLEIGQDVIANRVRDLTEKTRAALRSLGARLPFDEAPELYDSPIISARFEDVDASKLALQLRERKVLVSARHGSLRVSPHFYNDESDIDRLVTELKPLLKG